MPEISQKRVRELATQAANSSWTWTDRLDAAVRLGIREGLEVAAREAEWESRRPVAERIRAITIEGEQR